MFFQILIDNGFTPEWITLQKEIREDIQFLRDSLAMERRKFPSCPLNVNDKNEWECVVNKYIHLADNVNKKINKYNLLVPMINQQMITFNLVSESEKVLANGSFSTETEIRERKSKILTNKKVSDDNYIFDLLQSIFKK